jgi:hypothetical protein
MLGFVLLLPGVAHASPFSLAAYDEAVRQDGPAVYWRLGEQTGTVAADASGNARDATYASPAEQRTRTGCSATTAR